MSFYLSDRSLRHMEGVDELLIRVAKRAIQITRVDFGIPESGGLRTAEQQHVLFLNGASKADGYNEKSFHQSGRALDFYAYVNGTASWDGGLLAQVACAFFQAAIDLNIRVEWGGLFRSIKDMPHIQLKRS